jgi:hypothetical protein
MLISHQGHPSRRPSFGLAARQSRHNACTTVAAVDRTLVHAIHMIWFSVAILAIIVAGHIVLMIEGG